jgi:hypothetical protein
MQSNYLVISEHGLAFRVMPDESVSKLKFMQALVDGLIERVPYHGHDGVDCWVNEEGMMRGMNVNITASIICNHMIAGTAIFAGTDGEDIAPCPEDFIKSLTRDGLAIENFGLLPDGSGRREAFEYDDVITIIKADNEGAKDAKSL